MRMTASPRARRAATSSRPKSVNDLLAPVSGIVTAVNANLDERPELVNTDPYGAGWLIDVQLSPGAGTADLLSATDYAQLIGR
jgi:glycine cleavage system H protein